MMLLNCAVDLLKQDYSALYLDSELNTRLFTARILAHLSGIEYKRLTSGNYTEDEKNRIMQANVLTFVRYYDKCGYVEAIEKLKKFSGFDGTTTFRKKLSAAEVAKRFSPPKKKPKQAKSTVLSDDYMERYEKRPDKLAVWEQEGISRASLDKFQVCYDSFSDRLVYPIRSPEGKIVNIGGRTMDEHWKEKNLRKYTYFMSWGELKTIYGFAENLENIKRQGEIILFEGCKSVLMADTWGINNAGAILTSHLNPNQMKLLIGLGCRVVFAFLPLRR